MGDNGGENASVVAFQMLNAQQKTMQDNISELYKLVRDMHADVQVIKATMHKVPCKESERLDIIFQNHLEWHEEEKENKSKEEKEANKWKVDKVLQFIPHVVTWAAGIITMFTAWKLHKP